MENQAPAVVSPIDSIPLKAKWRERFAFFEAHGAPRDPSCKAALKALPYRKRLLVMMNFPAFFLGPIYFFAMGMWRKGLTLLGCSFVAVLVAVVIEALFNRSMGNAAGLVIAVMGAGSANYSYYLKTVKGSNGWNFFEGQRII
jgi:hypothetical protein